MSEWRQRIEGHAAWERLRSLRGQVDVIDLAPDDPPEALADLGRLRTVLAALDGRFKATDRLFLVPGHLDAVDSHVQQVAGQIANFASNRNRQHLAKANQLLDGLITSCAQVLLAPADPGLAAAEASVASLRGQAEGLLAGLVATEQDLQKKLSELTQRLDAATQEVTAQKGRLDAAIAEYQKQFSTAESTRVDQFTSAQQNREQQASQHLAEMQKRTQSALGESKDKLGTFLAGANTEADVQRKDLANSATEVLEALRAHRAKAEELMHAIGSAGMAGDYQRTANSARNRSFVWHGIAAAGMIGLIVFAIWAFVGTQSDTIKWAAVGARVFVALAFGLVVAYGAREGVRYAEVENANRRFELELSSIGPFLANLDPPIQAKLKEELARKLFGNATTVSVADPGKASGDSRDLLKMALELVQAALKKQSLTHHLTRRGRRVHARARRRSHRGTGRGAGTRHQELPAKVGGAHGTTVGTTPLWGPCQRCRQPRASV
jgi:hypothetical protein